MLNNVDKIITVDKINWTNTEIKEWRMYEAQGIVVINPILYVYEIIKTNKTRGTITEENISELIKMCFDYVPDRKTKVLDMIEESFPQFTDSINKYRILLK